MMRRIDPILSRVNKIEGQIKAVKKMYAEGRSCADIVQQLQAARAALGKVATILLSDEAKRCADKGDMKGLKEVVDKGFRTL